GGGLPEGFAVERSDRLGLAIVKTLVESELDGVLRLRRREGGGTIAVIELPRSAGEASG
ncbi:MAG TPA: ATPase, partial [Mycobacteriales bacterium]|nr:ATPase [Mycobacteriales bacterium]